LIDEETETYEYTIYARDSYLDSAKWDDTEDPNNDDVYKTYHTYDHAVLTGRTTSNPQVSYNDVYRYFEFEDFGKAGYVYVNATDALDDANEFISSYSTLPESELPSAYGDWMAYSIDARLKAESLYDSNDDGVYDTNDGTPGLPSSMSMVNGKIDVIKKYRGKTQAVRLQYVNEQLEKYENIDFSTAFIYHSGVDKAELETIEEMAKCAGFKQVITAFTGCMISLHSGRGALGIHFLEK